MWVVKSVTGFLWSDLKNKVLKVIPTDGRVKRERERRQTHTANNLYVCAYMLTEFVVFSCGQDKVIRCVSQYQPDRPVSDAEPSSEPEVVETTRKNKI